MTLVWIIVAGSQNNDVCRASVARWIPLTLLFDGTSQRDLLSSSLVSQHTLNHGRWYHINHNSHGVRWLKHLLVYLIIYFSTTCHTECFIHIFHSRKPFLLYSALPPTTGDSAWGPERKSCFSWLASPCRCNWSWRCCSFTSTLLRCRVCIMG